MDDSSVNQSITENNIQERLLRLKRAEENVCLVLQLTADSVEELECLPFSDQAILAKKSDELINLLKSIRSDVVSGINGIRPFEVAASLNNLHSELSIIQAKLQAYEK